MANFTRFFAIAGFLAAMAAGGSAHASIVVQGTRVVYPADAREVTVKLNNPDQAPLLVQAWMDKGDEKAAPGSAEVPFTLTPPISRVDVGKGQTLRITFTGEPQAKDKETLYWLNVLSVPPKSKAAEGSNQLQFAFRTRLKVFFRPTGLSYPVTDAPSKLQWKLVRADKGYALEVSNPTPYYVSFSSVAMEAGGRSFGGPDNKGMVAPGDTTRFPAITDMTAPPGGDAKAIYEVITDYGGYQKVEAPLSH